MSIDCYCPPPISEWEETSARQSSRDDYSRLRRHTLSDDYVVYVAPHVQPQTTAEPVAARKTVQERFEELAEKWSKETQTTSSTSEIISNRHYSALVRLGWDVVPLMLNDLQFNRRFWFPALSEITGIRPFDVRDAGNSRKMLQAWVKWGKRKGLI